MDIQRARDFLGENHRAVLITTRGDGRPQASPVSVAVDADGYAVVSTREPAMKVKNLRRNPAASLCVFTDKFFGEWIQIDGTAHIVSLPDAMDGLTDYYRRVAGDHPDWDDYRAAMEREQRCLIRIDIDRAGPDKSA